MLVAHALRHLETAQVSRGDQRSNNTTTTIMIELKTLPKVFIVINYFEAMFREFKEQPNNELENVAVARGHVRLGRDCNLVD